MDCIIVLGNGSKHNNDELRICLRSIEKHYKPVGKVYICGFIPEFLKPSEELILVPCEIYLQRKWKDWKMWEQLLTVLNNFPVSEEFLLLNDDQFITADLTDDDFFPMWLKQFDTADKAYDDTPWKRALRKELMRFQSLNGKAYYWQPHIWSRFRKSDVVNAYFDCMASAISEPVLYSYIYNFARVEATDSNRCKDHRFYGRANYADAIKEGFHTTHVAYCDNAFQHREFRERCFELFPVKSKFEK